MSVINIFNGSHSGNFELARVYELSVEFLPRGPYLCNLILIFHWPDDLSYGLSWTSEKTLFYISEDESLDHACICQLKLELALQQELIIVNIWRSLNLFFFSLLA